MLLKKLDVALSTSEGFVVALWTCFKRSLNVGRMKEIDCSKKTVKTVPLDGSEAVHYLCRAPPPCVNAGKEGCLYIMSPAEFCLSLIPDDSGTE